MNRLEQDIIKNIMKRNDLTTIHYDDLMYLEDEVEE